MYVCCDLPEPGGMYTLCIYVCIYVFMYVCMYVCCDLPEPGGTYMLCMYVCMYVGLCVYAIFLPMVLIFRENGICMILIWEGPNLGKQDPN
jgi:hypothetical protein